ncbi:MAG: plastocyanin/azurin family copper-binding protein [Nitrososphaerales archaeon]
MDRARVTRSARVHASGRGAAAVVVVLIVAGGAYLFLNPAMFGPASAQLYTFTNNGNSISTSTNTTSVYTAPDAVQVYIPYGGGENDDGATNFLPQVITLVIGINNTVTWTNQDLISHNVISNTGVFASGDLSSGQTYTFTFAEAGTYPYYCSYHPMNGVVIVKNP